MYSLIFCFILYFFCVCKHVYEINILNWIEYNLEVHNFAGTQRNESNKSSFLFNKKFNKSSFLWAGVSANIIPCKSKTNSRVWSKFFLLFTNQMKYYLVYQKSPGFAWRSYCSFFYPFFLFYIKLNLDCDNTFLI